MRSNQSDFECFCSTVAEKSTKSIRQHRYLISRSLRTPSTGSNLKKLPSCSTTSFTSDHQLLVVNTARLHCPKAVPVLHKQLMPTIRMLTGTETLPVVVFVGCCDKVPVLLLIVMPNKSVRNFTFEAQPTVFVFNAAPVTTTPIMGIDKCIPPIPRSQT